MKFTLTFCDVVLDAAQNMSFDLVFSVKITQFREPKALRQRFSRFDVLLWTLESYSRLPITRAYLFIELAPEFAQERPRLRERAAELFGDRLRCLRATRIASQPAWRAAIDSTIIDDDEGCQRLIWFMQNDDHPFIDQDVSVLQEGLALLRAGSSTKNAPSAPSSSCSGDDRFRTIQPTHWPEALQLSGKFGGATRVGSSYIRSEQTLTDAVQIMTFAYFRYQTIELDWRGLNLTRMDSLIWGRGIYGDRRGTVVKYSAHLEQTMLVPLRELCRKFDGVRATSGRHFLSPPLVLPPSNNTFTTARTSLADLTSLMRPPSGRSYWAVRVPSNFTVPNEWIYASARLYGILTP